MTAAGGRKARTNGAAFEELIEGACNYYMRSGRAYIEKSPEPMKPIKPAGGGRFLACYTKAAQPDFKGTMLGGRAVCFEAKHTDGDRIDQKRVTPEQTEALNRHHELGATCFVLVSFRLERFYRVPWIIWRDMPRFFKKVSVNEDDLTLCRIDILRFLHGMEVGAR